MMSSRSAKISWKMVKYYLDSKMFDGMEAKCYRAEEAGKSKNTEFYKGLDVNKLLNTLYRNINPKETYAETTSRTLSDY